MTEEVAEWIALGKSRQRRIRSAIRDAFVAGVRARGRYTELSEEPRIDVHAATRDGDRVAVRFVVDYYLRSAPSPYSDDDWIAHMNLAGCAVYVRDQGVTVAFEIDRCVDPDEPEPSETQRAPHVAPPEAPDEAIVHCPKCGATDVRAESFYEITVLVCERCGNREPFDSWELREGWTDSGVASEPPAGPAEPVAPFVPRAMPPPPPENPIGDGPQGEIRSAALSLAELIADIPERGPFENVLQRIGPIELSGEVVLRLASNPLEDERRFVEVRVHTPSGKSWMGRWLTQGTNAQIAAFLRDVETPALIVTNARGLRRKLIEDEYE